MDGTGMDAEPQVLPPAQVHALTFAWLHERVKEYAEKSEQTPSRLEKWSFRAALGLAALALLLLWLERWIPSHVLVWPMLVCVIGEVAGMGLSLILMLKRELPQYVRPRETHAKEMDVDFARWQTMAEELRTFPREQREARLQFVITLRQNMIERMGPVFGGMQRLGILPVLGILYLQFRNWKWGDWASAFDVNLLAGLLIWAMLLLYGAGWLLVGLRQRLDTYVSLLEVSLRETDITNP